jgi:hypothetical protein
MNSFLVSLNFRGGGAIQYWVEASKQTQQIVKQVWNDLEIYDIYYVKCALNPDGVSGVRSAEVMTVGAQKADIEEARRNLAIQRAQYLAQQVAQQAAQRPKDDGDYDRITLDEARAEPGPKVESAERAAG